MQFIFLCDGGNLTTNTLTSILFHYCSYSQYWTVKLWFWSYSTILTGPGERRAEMGLDQFSIYRRNCLSVALVRD